MSKLEGQARHFDKCLVGVLSEIEKLAEQLEQKQKEKEKALVQGRSTESINEEIRKLKERIDDKKWLQAKRLEELRLAAQKIKEQRLSECKNKLDSYKAEKEKYNEEIKELHARIQKLKSLISINPQFLDGEVIEIRPEQNLAYQVMLTEGELEEVKHQTEEGILAELGIELEKERTEEVA